LSNGWRLACSLKKNLLRRKRHFFAASPRKSVAAYANDDGNFVLLVPMTCSAKKIVLVLELDCWSLAWVFGFGGPASQQRQRETAP
jgi:hypothetical protein